MLIFYLLLPYLYNTPLLPIMYKAINLCRKCRHFCILVIGRANAGKTTLLKKVCNSVEDPEIFSLSGKKVRGTYYYWMRWVHQLILTWSIAAWSHRSAGVIGGMNHNPIQVHSYLLFHSVDCTTSIANLYLKAIPNSFSIILMDSNLALSETETVNSFIKKWAKSMDLPSQLHAIWCGINHMVFRQAQRINRRYCLPMDTNRPLLDADRDFFRKYGSRKSQWAYLFLAY